MNKQFGFILIKIIFLFLIKVIKMGVGFFKKLKDFGSKIFNTAKKVFTTVNDKIVKPIISNDAITSTLSAIDPRAAAAVQGIKTASKVTDLINGRNVDTGQMLQDAARLVGPLSGKLKFR